MNVQRSSDFVKWSLSKVDRVAVCNLSFSVLKEYFHFLMLEDSQVCTLLFP